MKRQERNSSFELLRLLCILGVIFQHFYEGGIMNAHGIVAQTSFINATVLQATYYLARPAVNVFILISGYFMVYYEKRKIGRIIDLFILVCSYQTVCYLIINIFDRGQIGAIGLIWSFFPKNYYLFLYVTLYVLSPYINKLIESLSVKKFRLLILMLLMLFSVYSTMINFGLQLIGKESMHGVYTVLDEGTGRGFSIVGFMVMYFIGAYIRKRDLTVQNKVLFPTLIMLVIFNTTVSATIPKVSSAMNNYDSITIIAESVCIFLMAKNTSFKNDLINRLSASVFGIYVLHITVLRVVCPMVEYEEYLTKHNLAMILLFILGVLLLTFIIGGIIDFLLRLTVKPIAHKWKQTNLYNYDIAFTEIE